MEIAIEKVGKDTKKLTPQSVRDILGVDNSQILDLCKRVNLAPKRACDGQIYFSKEDVEILKRLKELHKVTSKKNGLVASKKESALKMTNPIDGKVTVEAINQIISSLETIDERLTNSIAKILDDKLDGMDEIVVELIRCKTENENLRFKINELNKENFALKNRLNSFKPIAFNLYVKGFED